jgi:F420-dependent oxidoreductase-like protein
MSMRVGVVIGRPGGYGDSVAALTEEYERASAEGLASVWLTQHLGFDALTLIAGWGTAGPELGTAVAVVQPRHPVVLAQQALTTQAMCGGRLALGLGLAHAATLESAYGLPPRRSVSHLADYLDVLGALLGGEAPPTNDSFTMTDRLGAELPAAPPVLLAALGPKMLQLAGERTAGTITWMTGPRTIESHVAPTIGAAADGAGRGAPRVVVCLPVCVTDDAVAARERYAPVIGGYGRIPSYRAMLDREGVAAPVDLAVIGGEQQVGEALTGLFSAGATDVAGIPIGTDEERAATVALLGTLARSS